MNQFLPLRRPELKTTYQTISLHQMHFFPPTFRKQSLCEQTFTVIVQHQTGSDGGLNWTKLSKALVIKWELHFHPGWSPMGPPVASKAVQCETNSRQKKKKKHVSILHTSRCAHHKCQKVADNQILPNRLYHQSFSYNMCCSHTARIQCGSHSNSLATTTSNTHKSQYDCSSGSEGNTSSMCKT